jgi:hypothetical protein
MLIIQFILSIAKTCLCEIYSFINLRFLCVIFRLIVYLGTPEWRTNYITYTCDSLRRHCCYSVRDVQPQPLAHCIPRNGRACGVRRGKSETFSPSPNGGWDGQETTDVGWTDCETIVVSTGAWQQRLPAGELYALVDIKKTSHPHVFSPSDIPYNTANLRLTIRMLWSRTFNINLILREEQCLYFVGRFFQCFNFQGCV